MFEHWACSIMVLCSDGIRKTRVRFSASPCRNSYKLAFFLNDMVKVLGILAVKGGVGKTTVASALACDLAMSGKKVLLIDANYSAPNVGLHMDVFEPKKTVHDVLQGRVRMSGAVHSRHGVDVVPGSLRFESVPFLKLHDKLSSIKHKYDFIVLDGAPSLHEEGLSTILASDYLFLVATPDYPTLSCSLQLAHAVKQRGKTVSGLILNKIRNPKYELSLQEMEQSIDIPVVAKLSDEPLQSQALFYRMPLPLYSARSSFSQEIHKLSLALSAEPERRSFFRRFFAMPFSPPEINRQLLKEHFYSGVFE